MPSYSVVSQEKDYEIRQYQPYVIAEVPLSGDPENTGFRALFRYISGENAGPVKIAMTAPVLKSETVVGQKLSMSAPVLTSPTGEGGRIAFVMPEGLSLEQLPRPQNGSITLRQVEGHRCAAITFSGYAGEAVVREKTELLLAALARDGVVVQSTPVTALYNPPWTPPFMRRNEVLIEIP